MAMLLRMLRGVELARRRRIHSHHDNEPNNRVSSIRERLPRSFSATPSTSMDATVLMARKRLEEKLGSFRSRSILADFYRFMLNDNPKRDARTIFGNQRRSQVTKESKKETRRKPERKRLAEPFHEGVELARRRRIHSHHDNERNNRDSSIRERLPRSFTATPSTSMDATALMARKRLEEKLGSFCSRYNTTPQSAPVQVRRSSHVHRPKKIQTSETRTTETKVRSSPELSRRNSQREVCAVCLDDLQDLREITYLPCAHSYHSDCLLPWLATHSHCPYCRTLVPAL
ncbi:hypothetical protein NE237_012419 [Protea cynaroides]|uniref:RING-type domain-containing protein n=1 Tax=Protea cynaroides TaxID=273540 RepID=A0A9Q0JXL6_9MAGN|nr:hypothetical protein NE237_012419 [Protea cynaroides]